MPAQAAEPVSRITATQPYGAAASPTGIVNQAPGAPEAPPASAPLETPTVGPALPRPAPIVTMTATPSASSWYQGRTAAIITTRLRLSTGARPTGTVVVRVDGAALAPHAVPVSGQVDVRLPSLRAGTHSVTSTYTPSVDLDARAHTKTLRVIVLNDTARVSVTRSAASYVRGRTGALVRATVRLDSRNRAPGWVAIKDGRTVLVNRAVPANGTVEIRLPGTLAVGTHTITATYTPTGAYGIAARTDAVTVSVAKPPVVTAKTKAAKKTAKKKAAKKKTAKKKASKKAAASKASKKATKNKAAAKRAAAKKAAAQKKAAAKKRAASAVRTISGTGARGARGANVKALAAQYLRQLGARNVTIVWDLSCPASRGLIYTSGRVAATSTTRMRLCVSGNFSSAYAKNALRFLVAHEYSHIVYNRTVGINRSVTYQSVANSERQADCTAAQFTKLPVGVYGSYTASCTGKLLASAKTLRSGHRPASLGR